MPNHWIGVVSRSHANIGIEGGFSQLNHGKKAPLQRLKPGDTLAIYSPRESYPDGRVLQVEMSPDFKLWRVGVEFFARTVAPIKPLVESLSFIARAMNAAASITAA